LLLDFALGLTLFVNLQQLVLQDRNFMLIVPTIRFNSFPRTTACPVPRVSLGGSTGESAWEEILIHCQRNLVLAWAVWARIHEDCQG